MTMHALRNYIVYDVDSDPICILCSARDHARETLRTHAATECLVSESSQSTPALTFYAPQL